MKITAEHQRLIEYRERKANWKKWGPYLSERSWGTAREDYSADGSAWDYFPHDHARSKAYRWGEDGIAGINSRLVPYTLFTDPQLGRIGMGEKEALANGHNIRIAKLSMSHVARAIEVDETRGFMKAIVDADTDQLLGAVVLGIEGGEVMAVFEMAMIGKVSYPILRDTIFAHPTLAESINNLFMNIGDEIKSDAS